MAFNGQKTSIYLRLICKAQAHAGQQPQILVGLNVASLLSSFHSRPLPIPHWLNYQAAISYAPLDFGIPSHVDIALQGHMRRTI